MKTYNKNPEAMSQLTAEQSRITLFASVSLCASKSLFVAAALAAVAIPDSASAARRVAGPYDGIWTTIFATTRGHCSSGYSVPFTVAGNRVSSAGGGRVSGSVRRGGSVAVSVSVGASRASGGGRLVGNFGSGRWSGIITGDRCSGTWRATRS
ncbi:hypothetical protein V1278_001839 [Bradyrhizobium sp. AZCC 1577]|uniref:hypothetical protein n=1 Tax=Bradyrhizobium sp. AZCC 1577 TaxID=3117019 RepID=UPI002FF0E345